MENFLSIHKLNMDYTAIYHHHWRQVADYVNSRPTLSPPLLLACPEQYSAQPVKLFIVGQQTRSWYSDEVLPLRHDDSSIDKLMEIYAHRFCLGINHRTPFWHAARKLESLLGISTGQILWSNLNKVDENNIRPSREVEEEILRIFLVLAPEIAVAKPDIIVFFTGPRFDELLLSTFPNAKIVPVVGYESILATIQHAALPPRTFRTYHPKFLLIKRQSEQVLRRIVSEQ